MQDSPLGQLQSIPNFGAETLQGGFDLRTLGEGRPLKGKGRQAVRFFNHTFTQVYATEVKQQALPHGQVITTVLKTGTRPVTKEMVEIVTPGDKNVHCDFADDWHRRQFFNQYQAFRDGKTAPQGQSVEDCPFISAPIATELVYRKCFTVEQLAAASDVLCDLIANGHQLRDMARSHVKAAVENSSSAQVNLLRTQLEQSNKMIAELQRRMDEQGMQMKSGLVTADGEAAVVDEKLRTKKGPKLTEV